MINFKPCIYMILNLLNGHKYIGSTISFKKRSNQHLNALKKNKHYNKHLQYAVNKYGLENFIIIPIEFCEKEELLKYEDLAFYDYKPEYNILKEPMSPPLGRLNSEETKRKMSETAKRINSISRVNFDNIREKIKDQYGNIYNSLTEASKKTNSSIQSICDNLNGRSQITRKGFMFKYFEDNTNFKSLEEINNLKIDNYKRASKERIYKNT